MRRMTFFGAALAALLGCNEATAPTPAGPVGAYALRSINGNPPPQIIESTEFGIVSFVGGLVTLNANGTFRDSTEVETVSEDGVNRFSDVGAGTWRVNNDTVYFRIGQSEYPMLRAGGELLQDYDGIELVYRR